QACWPGQRPNGVVNVINGKPAGRMAGVSPGLRVCGRLGPGDDTRVKAMARHLGDQVSGVLEHPHGCVWGAAPHVRAAGPTVAVWSAAPLPDVLPAGQHEAATAHSACSLDAAAAVLHTDAAGAVPLYLDEHDAHFSSRLGPLARTGSRPLRPDWDAWAHVIGAGAPLEGRTTFAGIRRLGPWTRVTAGQAGGPQVTAAGWPWLEIDEAHDTEPDTLREALAATVAATAALGPVAPLLSGGWDSRVLTALANRSEPGATAWTTSSDTGHALEQLVAAQVAATLGTNHEIIAPRWDQFSADLEHFAGTVDYQTSFHVWAVPLAAAVAHSGATVLDGLGGGIFVGGAFSDDGSARPVLDRRFGRLAHYLDAADSVLHPNVSAQVRERTRASFERVAGPLADHPFGATFTAYLTRTLPGISLSPFGLFADGSPVATPFLADAVVRAALAIPPGQHADGRLYPELLRPLAPALADLPTAAALAPRHRRHKRRVSSAGAASAFRGLLTAEPVRSLLAPQLARADIETWRALLDRTASQHLIRGLAILALWLQRYAPLLDDPSPDQLLEPAG
ncbi:MAG: asparagine synthase-related protein, partial [bacterium]